MVRFNSDTTNNSTSSKIVDQAILLAQGYLTHFALNENFLEQIEPAFGDRFNPAKLEELRQQWASGQFEALPTIEIRSVAEINSANGVFSTNTNTVYLSQEYSVQNSADARAIADVLLEEIGHSVDSQINVSDAPGDEGAIFSALAQGKQLDESRLQRLKIEDDSVVLTLDGKVVQIEQAVTDVKRPILIVPGIGGTFAKDFNPEWFINRGLKPEQLEIDPIAGVYYDLIQTLKNVGYEEGKNLFVANYDWRLPAGPQDNAIDGKIDGLSAEKITDGTYEYGVDYLGYWLGKAAESWKNQFPGTPLESVDVVAHSTGGLVTRAYIQSDAYGGSFSSSSDIFNLPKVNNFFMVGVPNRGASKAWNPLHDDWNFENSYRIVLSKIINKAYQKVLAGEVISGSPVPISLGTITDSSTNKPDPIKFINQYVPTIRDLLATYNFIDFGSDLTNINNNPSERNSFVLDLNAGLDLVLSPGDPNSFGSKSHPIAIYGVSENTPTTVTKKVGNQSDFFDEILPFTDFIARDPKPNEIWYEDNEIKNNGDGTVPLQSSRDQFKDDSRIELKPFTKGVNTKDTIGHTALMSNVDVQKLILNTLSIPFQESNISTNLEFDGLSGQLKSLFIALTKLDILNAGFNPTEVSTINGFINDVDNFLLQQDAFNISNLVIDSVSLSDRDKLNLNFNINFDSSVKGLPEIRSDLDIEFSLKNTTTLPKVAFNNVQLNLGSFFGDLVRPVLEKVEKVIEPINPLTDALTAEIPFTRKLPGAAKDILDFDDNGKINLLDLAQIAKLDPNANVVLATDYIAAAAEIIKLTQAIPSTDSLWVNLGSFDIGSANIRDNNFKLSGVTPNITVELNEDEVTNQISDNTAKSFITTSIKTVPGGGLQFPILSNPTQAFNLLLGKPANLFTYNMPALNVDFKFRKFFPILGPIGAELRGNLTAKADFDFGFDTEGLKLFKTSQNPADISEGFYISDWVNGQDLPEAELNASLRAFGALEALVARGGVGGGIYANMFADLVEIKEPFDGKIRISDFTSAFESNPASLFNLGGEVSAGLEAYAEVGWPDKKIFGKRLGKRWTFESDKVVLASFGPSSSSPTLPSPPPPILATILNGGVLRLNMGPHAGARLRFDTKDGSETFTIEGKSGTTVNVSAFGFKQEYTGVSKIAADGGKEDDIIELDANILLPGEFVGGDGNDLLRSSSGNDSISGGSGWDRIFSGDGNDLISGGDEQATVGNANNAVFGDQVYAGSGNDTVFGDAGNDALYGEDGEDTVNGGVDNDFIDGGANNDKLYGDNDGSQAGNDVIFGGAGDDELYGLAGNDTLNGEDGNDFLYGSTGDDELLGDGNNDFLKGEAGNDKISGGEGNDTVSYENSPGGVVVNIDEEQSYENSGGSNDLEPVFTINTAEAQDGFGTKDFFKFTTTREIDNEDTGTVIQENLEISGSLENLIGSQYNDVLIGSSHNNHIQGLGGNDLLIGNAGNDTLDGGDNIDTVSYRRDPGSVRVNLAANATDGFGSTDVIYNVENVVGSASNDEIIGDAKANTLTAGNGTDTLKGGAGNDSLYGEAGNDFLMGEAGDDLIDGGSDVDTVSYESSLNAVVVNLSEGVAFDGFGNTDTLKNLENIIGSQSRDTLIGNSQDNRIEGRAGNDRIFGEGGNDTLLGEDGDDTLVGGAGTGWPSDILKGGDGNDTASYFTAQSGVSASLLQKNGWAGDATGDQFNSIENLEGSNFNDFLVGDNGDNVLQGLAGKDKLDGGLGNDTLKGADGNDLLWGNDGNDLLEGDLGNDILRGGMGNDTLDGGEGDDTLEGGLNDDTLAGGEGNNRLDAGEGNNSVTAGNGNNIVYAGSGNDTVTLGNGNNDIRVGEGENKITAGNGDNLIYGGSNVDTILVGGGNNQIYAAEGKNVITTGNGDNLIYGGAASDRIKTGAGNDTIYAAEGNNYIDAGTGNNIVNSGSGSDLFVLTSGQGATVITQFNVGKDSLGLTGDLSFAQLSVTQGRDGNEFFTQIGIAGSNDLLATLKWVNASAITNASFTSV